MSSRYLQKWLRYDIKHVKNRHFSRHFWTLPPFPEFYFLTDFDASKSVLGSFFAFFAKIWPMRWPWPVLWSQSTGNDTYLQMSVILSMPIHWLCLRLTSKFYSPMSPSPKCQTFWLWPDLWRHWWPRGHYLFPFDSFSGPLNAAWIFRIGPLVSEISGGGLEIAPPPSGVRYKNTPVGRGLNTWAWEYFSNALVCKLEDYVERWDTDKRVRV